MSLLDDWVNRARDLAPWSERADIVLKALQMVSNERKGG